MEVGVQGVVRAWQWLSFTPRTDNLCDIFPLDDLDIFGHRYIPDLYDLAHSFYRMGAV